MIEKVTKKKVIIIGAGIAGLAACARLIELGFDVIILEARNRCGGRIWTDNKLGIPLGRGAGWIHGIQDNPIAKLAKRFDAKMVSVDPNQFVIFNQNGMPVKSDHVQDFNIKFDALLKQARELAYHSTSDISLSSAFSSLMQSENFSAIPRDLFENQHKRLECYMGAGYDFLSARTWDDAEMWPGENCFLTTSYQPILDGLAKNCPVRLNTVVSKINLCEKGVEIIAENSVLYADAVIITLPLGVLKKNTVTFNPPLPDRKQKAIQSLGMGLFNITAMKFPTVFWPKEPHAMFFSQFNKLSTSVFFNLSHFIQQPVLLGYDGGQSALQLEDFTDEELVKKIMANFKKHFGTGLPEPESYFITRWSRDPFSYGSYSYLQTGSTCDDYDAIAEPVLDRLFFAGEATCSKYPATTHGAYLSGVREAERINGIFIRK